MGVLFRRKASPGVLFLVLFVFLCAQALPGLASAYEDYENISPGRHYHLIEDASTTFVNFFEEDCTPSSNPADIAVTGSTCVAGGYITSKCIHCGVAYTTKYTPINKDAHKWSTDWTGKGNGTHTTVCLLDKNHTKTENCTPAKGKSVTVEPTCLKGGYTTHVCGVCKDSYTDTRTPATGHLPGAWKIVKAPTVDTFGLRERFCTACGLKLEQQQMEKVSKRLYGRTATLSGQPLQDDQGFRIHYQYAVIDLTLEGSQKFDVIASNRYRVGALVVEIADGKLTVSLKPHTRDVAYSQSYCRFFDDPAAFAALPLDTYSESPLPLDSPVDIKTLPGNLLFLRTRVDFNPAKL